MPQLSKNQTESQKSTALAVIIGHGTMAKHANYRLSDAGGECLALVRKSLRTSIRSQTTITFARLIALRLRPAEIRSFNILSDGNCRQSATCSPLTTGSAK